MAADTVRAFDRPIAPRPGSGSRWIVLAVLSLAQLMVILDSTIVNIALPTAQRALGFTDASRQWIVTGYALAFGSLLLLGGRLSDLLGRKRMFLIGVVAFAVASAVGGASTGFVMLLVARIAQGVAAALLAPAALSLVSVSFADDAGERGRAFSVFGAVSGAGGALGLLLGGVLTQAVSWRWCLFVNVAIAIVALAGALKHLQDDERPVRVRLDVLGAVLVALGLIGIVYGLGRAASAGWTNGSTVASVLTGVVLLVVFVLVERRVTAPLLPLEVLLSRTRGPAYLAVGITGIASFAVFLFLTYFLQDTLRFSPITTGLSFLPLVAMLVVGASVSGAALMPRVGPRLIVPVGCLVGAIGLELLTGLSSNTTYASGVLPALLVLGLGLGLVFGPAQNAATNVSVADQAGIASALVNATQQVGGSIGTAVFSALFSAAVTVHLTSNGPDGATAQIEATMAAYHLVFWTAAGVFLAGGILTAALFRSGPLPTHPGTATVPAG